MVCWAFFPRQIRNGNDAGHRKRDLAIRPDDVLSRKLRMVPDVNRNLVAVAQRVGDQRRRLKAMYHLFGAQHFLLRPGLKAGFRRILSVYRRSSQ